MSLKDRLTRLTGDVPKPAPSDSRQEKIAELRHKLDRVMSRSPQSMPPGTFKRRNALPLEDAVAGEEFQTVHGSFFLSRSRMKAGDVHGDARICDVACACVNSASFLAGVPMAEGVSLNDGLFLDTETTGLAGGTGTFPFLIGLGWFEDSAFVTCQLFARDFSEEGAMLKYLTELASGKRFLVTFNGKTFDMNLLAARLILNRCNDVFAALPHIDLLYPSRRMLAHRLDDARLSTIEKRILGVERNGDVPGSEIPQRYFDWLRQHDGRLLSDIFEHNRLDIVSMASLLKHLADLVDDSEEMRRSHHGDLLKLAGLIHERGDSQRATGMLERLVSSHYADVAVMAKQSLSLMYKKTDRWEEAAELWNDLFVLDQCNVFAAVELAKFYEHRTKEYEKALHLVRQLLGVPAHLDDAERQLLEYRLRRLHQKVSGPE